MSQHWTCRWLQAASTAHVMKEKISQSPMVLTKEMKEENRTIGLIRSIPRFLCYVQLILSPFLTCSWTITTRNGIAILTRQTLFLTYSSLGLCLDRFTGPSVQKRSRKVKSQKTTSGWAVIVISCVSQICSGYSLSGLTHLFYHSCLLSVSRLPCESAKADA